MENETFEAIHLICPNQHPSLLKFLFIEDSLKITKGLELASRPQFSQDFLIKDFVLHCYIIWPNFITRLCLLPKLFSKMCFVFHAWAFNDVMPFEYLKSQNLIISRTKRAFRHFSLIHKWSLLDIQTKIGKMY